MSSLRVLEKVSKLLKQPHTALLNIVLSIIPIHNIQYPAVPGIDENSMTSLLNAIYSIALSVPFSITVSIRPHTKYNESGRRRYGPLEHGSDRYVRQDFLPLRAVHHLLHRTHSHRLSLTSHPRGADCGFSVSNGWISASQFVLRCS